MTRGEVSELVCEKAVAAHKAGLITIICIGETEQDRDQGKAESVVAEQLKASVPVGSSASELVVAYEPVWAIGTGRTASPNDVQQMHAMIRNHLKEVSEQAAETRILYGGSVKADNAKELLALPDVDGALVGGAALKADSFLSIIEAAG